MASKENPKYFPLSVFPSQIQDYILQANQTLNLPVDYLASAVIFSAAMGIGNSVRLRVKNGWNEVAVLYIAIVGKPGINKSHPLDYGMRPLFGKEQEYLRQYRHEMSAYQELEEKERLRTPQPVLKQLLITDITPETISQVHENNLRGIGYYRDELIAWLNDFNRYHKGSDEQFWLSAFSNKSIRVNRANKKAVMIESPFIPVIGSIQPTVLAELFGEQRTGNGFTDRILFVFPHQIQKPHWKEEEMPENIRQQYENVIHRLFEIELRLDEYQHIQPYEIGFSPEAKARFVEWYNKNADEYNDPATPLRMAGSIAKSDVICCRLMLILQALYDASMMRDLRQIEPDTVSKAIRLTEYFKGQAKRVKQFIMENELRLSNGERYHYFQKLPDEFNRSEANRVAGELNLHLKTAEKYLGYFTRGGFLFKAAHNHYRKTDP